MATGVGNFLMKSVPPSRRQGALSPAAQLYRAIAKEVPRVLTIYDIDMDYNEVWCLSGTFMLDKSVESRSSTGGMVICNSKLYSCVPSKTTK